MYEAKVSRLELEQKTVFKPEKRFFGLITVSCVRMCTCTHTVFHWNDEGPQGVKSAREIHPGNALIHLLVFGCILSSVCLKQEACLGQVWRRFLLFFDHDRDLDFSIV